MNKQITKYSCCGILCSHEKAKTEIDVLVWKNEHNNHCHHHLNDNSYSKEGLNVSDTKHLC